MNLCYVVPMWYMSIHVCANVLWPGVTLSSTHNTSLVVEAIALHIHLNLRSDEAPFSRTTLFSTDFYWSGSLSILKVLLHLICLNNFKQLC